MHLVTGLVWGSKTTSLTNTWCFDGMIENLESPGSSTLSLSLCSQGLFMWTLQQGGWISYTEAQGSKSLRQKWPITLKAGPITGIAVIAITGQPGFKSQSTYSHLLMSLWLTWNVGAGSGAQISSSLQPNISFIRLANFSPPYLHFIDAETEA